MGDLPTGRAETETPVLKHSAVVPMSTEALADAAGFSTAFARWISATPEEHERWQLEAKTLRAAERAAGGPLVPLDLAGLLATLGFTEEYAEHLMQPYCTCGVDNDGWHVCSHADDLGLTP